jgi:hypothetical protein
VLEELGRPTCTEQRGDVEIVEYRYSHVKEKKSGFLFLFHNSTREEQVSKVLFEFRDGILQRYWRE